MSSNLMPRQDILQIHKTDKWYKQHLDFAESLLRNSDGRVSKMNRLFSGYNGKTQAQSVKYLTETYGKANRGKFIDYRVGRSKIDILHGEWLKTPLKSTIRTINESAIISKLDKYDTVLGAAYAKKDIGKLQEVGVNPMEGMDVPDPKDPEFKQKISPKDKNEIIMQRIVDAIIQELHMTEKFGANFLHGCIASRCMSKINVDKANGAIGLTVIDPRDGINFEFDNDPMLQKSFLMGHREKMPISEILTKHRLTDVQRNKLEQIRDNPDDYIGRSEYGNSYYKLNGQYCCDVIHIEWIGVKPKYTKLSPKTNSQMEFDDTENGVIELDLFDRTYEENKDKHDREAKKGKYEVTTEWVKEVYCATRIGFDIDIECGPKSFVIKDQDTGEPKLSYSAVVMKAVDGDAVSVQEVIENFSSIFNVVMYQILREVNKNKGKVVIYDRAGLPRKTRVKDVLYNLANDSFLDVDSSATGNMGGKDLPPDRAIREIDLGLSSSFSYLLQFKNEIRQTLDYITGINQERTGEIAASSTATNATASLEASRTITESLFFYMQEYVEMVLTKLAETAKIVWGLYKPDKLRYILGDEDFEYIQATADIAYQSYAAFMTNGRKEQLLRRDIDDAALASLNAKELRFKDYLAVKMADSLADAKAKIDKGWDEVQRVTAMQQQSQMQADAQMQQQQLATQIKIAQENREDMQEHELEKIKAKGQADLMVATAAQKGQMILDQNKAENEQEDVLFK